MPLLRGRTPSRTESAVLLPESANNVAKYDEVGGDERCGANNRANDPRTPWMNMKSRSCSMEDSLHGKRRILQDIVRRPQSACPPDSLENASEYSSDKQEPHAVSYCLQKMYNCG